MKEKESSLWKPFLVLFEVFIWIATFILSVSCLFQFIVVSLKDGMFNNANVLYKTRFVDGISTITRYSQLQNRKNEPAHKKAEKIRTKE